MHDRCEPRSFDPAADLLERRLAHGADAEGVNPAPLCEIGTRAGWPRSGRRAPRREVRLSMQSRGRGVIQQDRLWCLFEVTQD